MKLQEIKLDGDKAIGAAKIIGAIIIVVFVFIAGKKILEALGILEDPEVRKSRKEAQKAYEQSANEILSNQNPTKSDAEWKLIADILYEDLKYSSVSDNKEDAGYQISRVKNDADFIKLNDLFGTREEWWFGIPMGSAPFIQYVSSNLSRSKLDKVNANYASKGIKFRW